MLPMVLLLFASCEVEFTPNAQWTDTPVVYCVLDPDDDTAFVRVERCFLGEGSIYSYGTISDSLNYPQGAVVVDLIAYRWGQAVDTLHTTYALRQHQAGDFADTDQPIYYTTQHLDTTCLYKIEVVRTSDGQLLASTDSIPLILQTNPVLISRPSNTTRFGFHESSGGTAVCKITWNPLDNARRYQPIVRFYYGEEGDTLYVDLPAASVAAGNNSGVLSTAYSRDAFLNSLRHAFVSMGDTVTTKKYLEYVDLYLTACDEQLNVYMSSVASGTNLTQTTDLYTNIRGGVGIFAARRTHLYKHLLADNSMVPMGASNPGLHAFLKELGVGFE